MSRRYCELVQKDIEEYLKGKLSADRAKEVNNHVQNCIECREMISFMEKLGEVSNRFDAIITDEEKVWDKIVDKTSSNKSQFDFMDLLKSRKLQFAQLFLIVVLLLTGIYFYANNNSLHKDNKIATKQAVDSKKLNWTDDPVGTHTDNLVSAIEDL